MITFLWYVVVETNDADIPDVFLVQPSWLLYVYIPAVLMVLVFLFCVSCRDPGLMERVTVSQDASWGDFLLTHLVIGRGSWRGWLVLE